MNPGRNKEWWTEGGLNTDFTKGYDLIFPVEIWDGSSWALRRYGELGAQCTPVNCVKMLEVEVDKIILPSTQAEFRIIEAGGF